MARKAAQEPYPKGWIDTSEVASILEIQYQRARDLMLQKRCGPIRMHGHRTRLVLRETVLALKRTTSNARAAQG